MAMSLAEIHKLEMQEKYPDAIQALEERLKENPHDGETITRLGFNLWYAAEESDRMGIYLPVDDYFARVMELLDKYRSECGDNADFCWAIGLGISLFHYYFPSGTQELGDSLLAKARRLDPFYARFMKNRPRWYFKIPKFIRRLIHGRQERRIMQDTVTRFRGRGIFAKYYNIEGIERELG